jgi:hypothetical protein
MVPAPPLLKEMSGVKRRESEGDRLPPPVELHLYSPTSLHGQETPRLLWNPKVHSRVYKSPSLIPTLGKMHLVHVFSSHFPKMLSSHLRLGFESGLLPTVFPTKILYAFLISHTCYMPRPSDIP